MFHWSVATHEFITQWSFQASNVHSKEQHSRAQFSTRKPKAPLTNVILTSIGHRRLRKDRLQTGRRRCRRLHHPPGRRPHPGRLGCINYRGSIKPRAYNRGDCLTISHQLNLIHNRVTFVMGTKPLPVQLEYSIHKSFSCNYSSTCHHND